MLKLDRRLIRVATIPLEVVESVAQALGRDAAAVLAYLRQPPRFAAGVSYRADATPVLTTQETFADAVREDLTLSDNRRAHLLGLEAMQSSELDEA